MDKIDKTAEPYVNFVDESSIDEMPDVKLRMIIVDKINEIIDWINTQG